MVDDVAVVKFFEDFAHLMRQTVYAEGLWNSYRERKPNPVQRTRKKDAAKAASVSGYIDKLLAGVKDVQGGAFFPPGVRKALRHYQNIIENPPHQLPRGKHKVSRADPEVRALLEVMCRSLKDAPPNITETHMLAAYLSEGFAAFEVLCGDLVSAYNRWMKNNSGTLIG